ncbi:hypothetical protein ACHAWF_014328 [Thalassiosira exigua]
MVITSGGVKCGGAGDRPHHDLIRARALRTERLFVVERGNSGEDLALQELQRRSASGGDVRHVSRASRQLRGRDGVSSSDDGGRALLLGQVREDVHDSEGALLERLHLEHAHGTVHDDGLAVGEELLLLGRGVGSVVESHPPVGDGVGRDDLGVRLGVELVGDNDVGGEEDLLPELLRLLEDFLGGVDEVFLDEGGPDAEALRLEEGEDHASSDDDLVALVEEGIEDGDLGGDLGSTDDGGHGLLSRGDGAVEVLELLGEEESRHGGLEELGHALGGGVRAVGRAEGVVDEEVEGSGEVLDEASLVLGLLLVEAGVLEHDHVALRGTVDDGLDVVADAVGGKLDLLAEELAHALGAGSEAELVLRSILGAAEVGADGDDGALVLEVLDGGDGGADAGVIGDGLAVEGHVHVAPDEDLLALELGLAQVLDGFLGLEFEGGGGGERADSEGGGGGGECRGDGEGQEGDGGVDELHGWEVKVV